MRNLLIVSCLMALINLVSAANITVFAASSLTEAFSTVAAVFETQHPGTNVTLNFSGSSMLSSQLLQGAPADVFASADETQMTRIIDAGLTITTPKVFALNLLSIITPVHSNLVSPKDLQAESGILLVLATPEVPAGRYARQLLTRLEKIYGVGFSQKVLSNLVSEEISVRQAAAKVMLDEADVTIVYRSDLHNLQGVKQLPIPEGLSPVARFPIALLSNGRNPELAIKFVDFVLSSPGQNIISQYGFLSP